MALSEQQVSTIWQRTLAQVKASSKEGVLIRGKDGFYPELWTGYNRSCDERQSLLPHIESGVFPDRLFSERAPNQTQAEFDYVRANYKQVTLPVFNDLENTVGRAMSKGNWSIKYNEGETEEAFQEYVNEGIKEWGSVFNFIRFGLIRPKISDAMGVVVVAPKEVPVIESEDGMVIDPSAEVMPDVMYFDVEHVWGFEYDRWYLLRLYENSDVMYGNSSKNTGIVCWLIDDVNVYRIEQYGKQTDWTFNISVEFPHDIGYAPCIHMMGVPSAERGKMRWQSPYLAAREVLDVALTDAQYLQVSKVKTVYPHTVMIGNPCDFIDTKHNSACAGTGFIHWFDEKDNARSMTCPSCSGTGKRSRLSPFGELLVAPNTSTEVGDGVNATNALTFVSPTTESVRFIREEVEQNIRTARKIIHVDVEAPMTGGDAKTATEAGLNAKAKDAFVKPIADQMFVIYDFILETIGKMKYGKEFVGFELRPPSHYDMRTDADYLAEIASAIEGKLPPSIIDYMVWQYMGSKYSDEPTALDALETIGKADRFSTTSWEIISAEAATGRALPWEIMVHFSGMYIYDLLTAEEGETFLALDVDKRAARLQEKAKELSANSGAQKAAPLKRLEDTIRGNVIPVAA